MSLTTVRSVVAGYLGGTPTSEPDSSGQTWQVYRTPNMTGVATLFMAEPSDDNQSDYFAGLPAGTRLGVKASLKTVQKLSRRTAFGGDHDGIRANNYQVTVSFYAVTASPHADAAHLDFDAVLDGVETLIYADRSLGTLNRTDGYYIDAGEGPNGLSIRPEHTQAVTPDGRLWMYAEMSFTVREWVHA